MDENTQKMRDQYGKEYAQSQLVTDAYNKLQATLKNKPGAFSSIYQQQLDNIYNRIMNREKFAYNMNADPMYQMYKEEYTKQGKRAMQDTIGAASALTGGYGNSYAETAGQQIYQNYLEKLNEIVPTLYSQAYQRYQDEGDQMYRQYSMTGDQYNRDYDRYRDTVSDWQNERSFDLTNYQNERNFDYDKYMANRAYWSDEYWRQKNAEQESENWNTGMTSGTSTTSGTSATSGTSSTTGSTHTTENSQNWNAQQAQGTNYDYKSALEMAVERAQQMLKLSQANAGLAGLSGSGSSGKSGSSKSSGKNSGQSGQERSPETTNAVIAQTYLNALKGKSDAEARKILANILNNKGGDKLTVGDIAWLMQNRR